MHAMHLQKMCLLKIQESLNQELHKMQSVHIVKNKTILAGLHLRQKSIQNFDTW